MHNAEYLDPPAETRASRKAKARQERRASKPTKGYQPLIPRTETQRDYMESLASCDQVFSVGPAGTGKTYIAARHAVRRVLDGRQEKIVIARPTVSKAKHRLGFRPGTQDEKVADWLVPLMDGFKDEATPAGVDRMRKAGQIEFAAFETLRGRTFRNAVVILDEAQNCDLEDLRLFLTRVGTGTQVIVDGDLDQIDISDSGLSEVLDLIEENELSADIIEFGIEDVVRSPIASEWVKAFSKRANSRNS